MKAAVCLRGVFYYNHAYNWYTNYKETLESFNQNLLIPLLNAGYEVDIFISTYDMPFVDESGIEYSLNTLTADYKPIKIITGTFDIFEEHYEVAFRHLKTLFTAVKDYQTENNFTYDLIAQARLDVKFNWPIDTAPENYEAVDYTKFNISYKTDYGNSDDCFWIFNGSFLDDAINGVNTLQANNSITHKIHDYISEPVHYLADCTHFSANQNITLVRKQRNNIYFNRPF